MLHIKDMEYHGMYDDMECHGTYKRYGVSWYYDDMECSDAIKDNSLQ